MSRTQLRKIATIDVPNAEATYEAVRDGKVLGTVTKFIEPAHGMKGGRDGVSRVTCWEHSREKGLAYDTRKDAVLALESLEDV